jgi:hypothetical protein
MFAFAGGKNLLNESVDENWERVFDDSFVGERIVPKGTERWWRGPLGEPAAPLPWPIDHGAVKGIEFAYFRRRKCELKDLMHPDV